MSIQGNINQLLGNLSSLMTTSAIAKNTAKQSEELARINRDELTDEELDIIEKAHGLPDDDNAMDLIENRIGSEDEINQIKARLSDEEYKKYTDAIYKQIRKEQRDLNIKGLSITPNEMQQTQYSAYRNLANLKLGEVNNRARYAQGTDQYDLSNDDWGVQG